MAYQISFTANGLLNLTINRKSAAKEINDSLKAQGIVASVSTQKIVDFNKVKKEATPAQLEALKKAHKARKAKKEGAKK